MIAEVRNNISRWRLCCLRLCSSFKPSGTVKCLLKKPRYMTTNRMLKVGEIAPSNLWTTGFWYFLIIFVFISLQSSANAGIDHERYPSVDTRTFSDGRRNQACGASVELDNFYCGSHDHSSYIDHHWKRRSYCGSKQFKRSSKCREFTFPDISIHSWSFGCVSCHAVRIGRCKQWHVEVWADLGQDQRIWQFSVLHFVHNAPDDVIRGQIYIHRSATAVSHGDD